MEVIYLLLGLLITGLAGYAIYVYTTDGPKKFSVGQSKCVERSNCSRCNDFYNFPYCNRC